jgi:hypothetical protein
MTLGLISCIKEKMPGSIGCTRWPEEPAQLQKLVGVASYPYKKRKTNFPFLPKPTFIHFFPNLTEAKTH